MPADDCQECQREEEGRVGLRDHAEDGHPGGWHVQGEKPCCTPTSQIGRIQIFLKFVQSLAQRPLWRSTDATMESIACLALHNSEQQKANKLLVRSGRACRARVRCLRSHNLSCTRAR
jgi:hypothetical protein